MKAPYFVSWSGGKDSCLALHHVAKELGKPTFLVTMLTEEGVRSRSHGLEKSIILAQAKVLDVEPIFSSTHWHDYEANFLEVLRHLQNMDVKCGIFGDIKIADVDAWSTHRQWADSLCSRVGMACLEPLWDRTADELEETFLASGIRAIIVAAKASVLGREFLGREVDQTFFKKMLAMGIHPLGEQGEYHTLVIDAPLFDAPIRYRLGAHVLRDGYWFIDVSVT